MNTMAQHPLRTREAIREASRFARMRMGQEAPEPVTLPSKPEIRVAIVPLTEAESQAGLIRAAQLDVLDNAAGISARNRAALQSDVWHATREIQDPEQKVWDSIEEMTEDLDAPDIDWLFDQLTVLMDYTSPNLNHLSDEEIDELKKAFGAIEWRDLSGKPLSALILCLSTLLPELLQAKFFSTTSTESSTLTSESAAST